MYKYTCIKSGVKYTWTICLCIKEWSNTIILTHEVDCEGNYINPRVSIIVDRYMCFLWLMLMYWIFWCYMRGITNPKKVDVFNISERTPVQMRFGSGSTRLYHIPQALLKPHLSVPKTFPKIWLWYPYEPSKERRLPHLVPHSSRLHLRFVSFTNAVKSRIWGVSLWIVAWMKKFFKVCKQ